MKHLPRTPHQLAMMMAGRKVEPEPEHQHRCHWPGCNVAVPPAMWGCRAHWFKIPKPLRDRIYRSYRPGQEIDKRPSREYLEAAKAVQQWIQEQDK